MHTWNSFQRENYTTQVRQGQPRQWNGGKATHSDTEDELPL